MRQAMPIGIQSTAARAAAHRRKYGGGRRAVVYDLVATAAVLSFASYVAWSHWRAWAQFPGFTQQVVVAAVLLLLGKGTLARRFYQTPTNRLAMAILWVLTVFSGWAGWILLTRSYYSRPFLLVSLSLLIAWQVIDILLIRTKRVPLRLVAVPSDLVTDLIDHTDIDIDLLSQPRVDAAADGIVVDLHAGLPDKWTRFLAESAANGIPIYHAATVYEAATTRVSLQYADSDWLRQLIAGSAAYLPVKRVLDIALVLLSLPVAVPLCLIVAVAVKLQSPGPALFWQDRIGKHGRIFRLVKFRSMRLDAENGGTRTTASADDRVTRVGRFLRRHRLDELPQLWNVLKGEMSVIGPRPEQIELARHFEEKIPFYRWRHRVKPGITGWAQVQQGYAAGVKANMEKLEYDLYYVKHLSFWLDLSVLLRTVRTIITGFGSR